MGEPLDVVVADALAGDGGAGRVAEVAVAVAVAVEDFGVVGGSASDRGDALGRIDGAPPGEVTVSRGLIGANVGVRGRGSGEGPRSSC